MIKINSVFLNFGKNVICISTVFPIISCRVKHLFCGVDAWSEKSSECGVNDEFEMWSVLTNVKWAPWIFNGLKHQKSPGCHALDPLELPNDFAKSTIVFSPSPPLLEDVPIILCFSQSCYGLCGGNA